MHSKLEDPHSKQEGRAQETANPLCEGTRPSGRCAHKDFLIDANATKFEHGSEQKVLKGWRTSAFWRQRGYYCFTGTIKMEEWSLDWWKHHLDHYGGAPSHIATPQAHRQAVEIAHELSAILGVYDPGRSLHALAFWVCRAHAGGKPINSLAFIAEELARRCDDRDDCWLWDLPFRIPEYEAEQARKLANQAAPALEGANIKIDRRVLFSTIEIEHLAGMIKAHGWNAVVAGINHELRAGAPKLGEDYRVCGWSWFKDAIEAARQEATRPRTAPRRTSADAEYWVEQRAAIAARDAEVREAAKAAIAQLMAAGIEADERKLLYKSQIMDLGIRFGRGVAPGEVLPGAVTRWLKAPTRNKVSAWSNIGEAIRAELVEYHPRRRAAA